MTERESVSVRLQEVVEGVVQHPGSSVPGALLCATITGGSSWCVEAGVSEIEEGTAMRPDDRFRAGSVMKPFVAAVVLQLAEEGLLSLDDPLTAVLPADVTSMFAASDRITVRMLLNHTSGIPEWLTDEARAAIAANPVKVWSDTEYFQMASSQTPCFPPGEGFTYSNTDYNLLGLVIEHASGRPWQVQIRERIVERLQLSDTVLPEPGDLSIPGSYAHGYMDMGSGLVDMSEIDPSMAGAAGGHALVTTTAELARFLGAMLSSELFQEGQTLAETLTFVDMAQDAAPSGHPVGYGLGIMKFLLPGDVEMVGHPGTTGGYQCFVYSLPNQRITISGMMSNMASDQMELISPALEILIPGFSP